MNRWFVAVGCVLGLSCGLSQAGEAKAPRAAGPVELWSVVKLQGLPAGWMVLRESERDGVIRSEVELMVRVSRNGQTIEMPMAASFDETTDGKPIGATSRMKMGFFEMQKQTRFTDEKIEVTEKAVGMERRGELPLPEGDWFTPAAGTRYVTEQIEAGSKRIELRMFEFVQFNRVESLTIEVLGEETVEVYGRTIPATKISTTMSSLPGIRTITYVDSGGRDVKSTVEFGGIRMEIVAADKALALAQREPPELLAETLVKVDEPIAQPRRLTAGRYRLSVAQGELPDLPETPVQRFRRIDERTGVVSVRLDRPFEADGEAAPRITASRFINGEDEKVVELTKRATADAGNDGADADAPAARAEAMRRFVHGYIEAKDLSVGFATAGEVARSRQGDCTEHAVLLAAMLRADGIPGRTVSGLVYVDQFAGERNVFGYHKCTQAWLGGRWVDLDATLGPETPFDATHITMSTSEMDEADWLNDLVRMTPLIGRLEIERDRLETEPR